MVFECPNIMDLGAESVGFSVGSLWFIKVRMPTGEHLGCWATYRLWGSVELPAGKGTWSQ